MTTKRYPFNEWLPDQPSVVNALQDINNVLPASVGYLPFPTPTNLSLAAGETLNNVFALNVNGDVSIFAGSTAKLYKLDNSTFALADKSKSGGYSGSSRWKFIQFGTTLLATNNSTKIQSWNGILFQDVAAAAPISKYITIVRDFVVAANVDGVANKLQWSDLNDETNWTSGAASQSDFQIIADGGDITGITGGEIGIVLLQRAVVRMSYIGSPYFFQFDTISRGLGCVDGNSIAQYQNLTFFLSDDGFYSTDGQQITPIGIDKVDKTFYKDADITSFDSMSTAIDPIRKVVIWNYKNVSGGRTLLMYNWVIQRWSKASTDVDYISSLVTTNKALEALDSAYLVNAGSFVIGKNYTIETIGTTNFTTGSSTVSAGSFTVGKIYTISSLGTTTNTQWNTIAGTSGVTYTTGMTFTAATTGASSGTGQATLGAIANTIGLKFTATSVGSGTGNAVDMDAALAASKTLDTFTTSLDDRSFAGGKYIFAGTRGQYIVVYNGANATASIVVGDIEEGYNSVMKNIRAQVEGGSFSVQVASRRLLEQDITYGSLITASNGKCSTRSAGRYHRVSLTPVGDNWQSAVSIDVDFADQGTR